MWGKRVSSRSKILQLSLLLGAIQTIACSASTLKYQFVDLYPFAGYGSPIHGVGDGQAVNGGAFVWGPPEGRGVDLHQPEYTNTAVVVARGGQQAGSGFYRDYADPNGGYHALLWRGTADSMVDLAPPGQGTSGVNGIDASHQVGVYLGIYAGNYQAHAALWSGSAASFVDLGASGFTGTEASGVGGGKQVGDGWLSTGYKHALLWSGTAGSQRDLHPALFLQSVAYGTDGLQEVGVAYNYLDGDRAFVWSGSAASGRDLTPSGYVEASAVDVYGGVQVGFGITDYDGPQHALAWSGTADSVVDLNQLLPASFTGASASSINQDGVIFGLAGRSDGTREMVKWVPIPEPAALSLPCVCIYALFRRVRLQPSAEKMHPLPWDAAN